MYMLVNLDLIISFWFSGFDEDNFNVTFPKITMWIINDPAPIFEVYNNKDSNFSCIFYVISFN